MHRTADRVRRDPAARLGELGRQRPEWRTWLGLLGEVERAQQGAAWLPSLEDDAPAPGAAAPLLHRRRLKVDRDRLQRLVGRLAAAAGSLERYRPSAEESVRLVAAAVRQDAPAIAALAAAAGVEPGALSSVAHLATRPLLLSCGRALESRMPIHWPHGHCPVCAAWPVLAERRGLDQSRRLRCGRCAADWVVQWLCCAYCGERDHQHLGTLVPDQGGEIHKVEVCEACRGYLKSVATLQRIPALELLLRDLETVELDLVALNRGYGRPEDAGFALEIELE